MSSRPIRGTLGGVFIAALLATAGSVSVASAQASTLPSLTLAITPTSITVGGSTQSGAVNVVVTDTGVKEAQVILARLNPGASFEEAEAAIKATHGDTNALDPYGSLAFDVEVNPGKTTEAQTYLQPGEYVAVLPGGEGKGSKAHAAFTVTAAVSPVALPAPQAVERSIEFGFRGPSTLHDGELVRFENEGYLVHMDIAAPVKSMKAARKLVKDLVAGKEKGIDKLISGEPATLAGPLSHDAYQQETITAKPGIYVQVCFMETQDGRDHALLGMERIIKITK